MKLYFIACPYSHANNDIVQQRFDLCTSVATRLTMAGYAVYSQITMSHPMNLIATKLNKKIRWAPIDEAFMAKCDELIVLTLPGWDESSGVASEIEYFKSRNRKVWTYDNFSMEHKL